VLSASRERTPKFTRASSGFAFTVAVDDTVIVLEGFAVDDT
jgi:hypothetical protein